MSPNDLLFAVLAHIAGLHVTPHRIPKFSLVESLPKTVSADCYGNLKRSPCDKGPLPEGGLYLNKISQRIDFGRSSGAVAREKFESIQFMLVIILKGGVWCFG